jgi:nucleoside-diphosphate kinase
MERTLVLIKPDGVQRGLVGEIIKRFENTGLKIVGMKMVYADEKRASKHYTDDESWLKSVGEKTLKSAEKRGIKMDRTALEQGKWIRELLMSYLTMSPLVALVLEGNEAVGKVRLITGPTNPQEAPPGTIRGDFSVDSYQLGDQLERPIQNLIHASENPKEAEREIKVWFNKEELHFFKRVDEDLIYRKGKKE